MEPTRLCRSSRQASRQRVYGGGNGVADAGRRGGRGGGGVGGGGGGVGGGASAHRTAETCRVNVSVEIRDPAAAHLAPKKSNRAVFVFAARSRTLLVPESYSEVLMHVDAARLLLNAGAAVDKQREGEWSPFGIACALGNVDVATLLVERGAVYRTSLDLHRERE